jgi:hypothetical protein
MRAEPLRLVPGAHDLLVSANDFYGENFNIGMDLLVYRDGLDSCGWHADDTQEESRVVCMIVEGDPPRPVKFRPKSKFSSLCPGDEEVQIWPAQGDAYDFCGLSQRGYEHCLPKRKKHEKRRMVIILRAGKEVVVPEDSGKRIEQRAPSRTLAVFGHCALEELSLHKRSALVANGGHRLDRRGIAGSLSEGAEAVISSRTDETQAEHDELLWLTYTSSMRQGGGALGKSKSWGLPIRLFRSSSLGNALAPPTCPKGGVQYRYDGLYRVIAMYDECGAAVTECSRREGLLAGVEPLTTFRLGRCQSSNRLPDQELRLSVMNTEARTVPFDDGDVRAACEDSLDGMINALIQSGGRAVNYSVTLRRKLAVSNETIPYAAQIARETASGKNKETWVQCTRCSKWRRLAGCETVSIEGLKGASWECSLNSSSNRNSCAVDEEGWESNDEWVGDWQQPTRKDSVELAAGMYASVCSVLGFHLETAGGSHDGSLPTLRTFRKEAPLVHGRPVIPCEPSLAMKKRRKNVAHPFGKGLEPCNSCRLGRQGGVKCRVLRGHVGGWQAPPGFHNWLRQQQQRSADDGASQPKGGRENALGAIQGGPEAGESSKLLAQGDTDVNVVHEISPPQGYIACSDAPELGPSLVGSHLMLHFDLPGYEGWQHVVVVKFMTKPVAKKRQFNVNLALCCAPGHTVRARLTRENYSTKPTASAGSWLALKKYVDAGEASSPAGGVKRKRGP